VKRPRPRKNPAKKPPRCIQLSMNGEKPRQMLKTVSNCAEYGTIATVKSEDDNQRSVASWMRHGMRRLSR
tara:strand:+ start:439 stop:648 length:210 start_codon:yes stop_codon:yes gene_type:complete